MLVYLRDGSAQTIVCASTPRQVADQTFRLTQSQYTDTGPTSPSTDPKIQAPGRVAIGVPIFNSLVWLNPEKSWWKRDSNPGSSALEADTLTTRLTRQLYQFWSHWYNWTGVVEKAGLDPQTSCSQGKHLHEATEAVFELSKPVEKRICVCFANKFNCCSNTCQSFWVV